MRKKLIGFILALACAFAGCIAFELGHTLLLALCGLAMLCTAPLFEDNKEKEGRS